MGKKCVIVGGCGFLGQNIAKALSAKAWKVTAIDTCPPHKSLCAKNADFIHANADSRTITRALKNADALFHMAWTTVPASPFKEIELDATANIADSVKLFKIAASCGVKKIIFPSSGGAVYGNPEKLPADESQPTNPVSSYGIAKLAVEKYLPIFHKHCGLDYLILRISNPFGPGQLPKRPQGLIANVVYNILHGKPVNIFGKGEAVRDYIYIDDVANAAVLLLEKNVKNEIFNLGSGDGRSIKDVVVAVSEILGKKPNIVRLPERDSDVSRIYLKTRKLRKQTGWRPETGFSEGLRRTADWIKNLG